MESNGKISIKCFEVRKFVILLSCHIADVILCRNDPVAEIAENDGRRQAQPLRGYLFIVLTLLKIYFI
jgi:hypothetical protein